VSNRFPTRKSCQRQAGRVLTGVNPAGWVRRKEMKFINLFLFFVNFSLGLVNFARAALLMDQRGAVVSIISGVLCFFVATASFLGFLANLSKEKKKLSEEKKKD
jgi:putative effector of murein hydrolase LrgA (UPF0299 family)